MLLHHECAQSNGKCWKLKGTNWILWICSIRLFGLLWICDNTDVSCYSQEVILVICLSLLLCPLQSMHQLHQLHQLYQGRQHETLGWKYQTFLRPRWRLWWQWWWRWWWCCSIEYILGVATVFERKNARNCFESTLSWEPDLTVRGACCGTAWPLGGASSSVGPKLFPEERIHSLWTQLRFPGRVSTVHCSSPCSASNCLVITARRNWWTDWVIFFGPHQIPPLVVEFR